MTFISLQIGESEFAARLLAERSPQAAEALRAVLPQSFTILQEEWSGAFVKGVERVIPAGVECRDAPEPYQAPGRLYLDPQAGSLAICYGPGRLQTAVGLVPVLPVAEVVGALAPLADACRAVQFDGATTVRISGMDAEPGPTASARPEGTRLAVTLAGARVAATLLENECPDICRNLLKRLPVSGVATNTHSSGPLVRFWNATGGAQGETPLDPSPEDLRLVQTILVPGSLYYLPKMGFRGLRIPFREPTIMRSAISGGGGELIAIARFEGDWSSFREAAARLRQEGALPMGLAVSD